MSWYKCALGRYVEVGEPCRYCGAGEDSEDGCLGAKWKLEREMESMGRKPGISPDRSEGRTPKGETVESGVTGLAARRDEHLIAKEQK